MCLCVIVCSCMLLCLCAWLCLCAFVCCMFACIAGNNLYHMELLPNVNTPEGVAGTHSVREPCSLLHVNHVARSKGIPVGRGFMLVQVVVGKS